MILPIDRPAFIGYNHYRSKKSVFLIFSETEEMIMTTITKEMTIKQVLDIDRTTAPIMMEYGMHCMGCPFSQMESLQDGCAAHGTDVDELVEKLNAYLAQKA